MSAPAADPRRPELADVVREHAPYLEGLTLEQERVLQAIASCRTAALGGHVRRCDHCGHREISYNSCRDRHCPKCQGLDEAEWIEARREDLLPVSYFHVVFTVPAELHPLFLAGPRAAYNRLFLAVAETLEEVALERLGARIGFTAVLHTWTQTLLFHPHVHCIVAGGGLDPEGERWIPARRDYFLPVRVLSEVFRGKLLSKLDKALAKGEIRAPSGEDPRRLLRRAARKKWVVYCKPPFAGPQAVLAYLGRYTHRIAISNDRLVSLKDGQVTFRWRDRAQRNAPRFMTLEAGAFLRRFLLHVLPRHLVRIRHYGFLANAVRRENVPRCRRLLGIAPKPQETESAIAPETWEARLLRLTGKDVTRCPCCGVGRLHLTEELARVKGASVLPPRDRGP
ncbi:MAG: IS91 family transposase [Planctomycetes bacterium]|nr:IS91 family transposase [Planctomycetota bacterium]